MGTFNTPHNEAFRTLGALEPGQHWSSFDVPRNLARAGKASRFVTTIWNYHSTLDERNHRTPTEIAICRDQIDGTFWYRLAKPPPGETRRTWIAHWNGLELALKTAIPIIGVLKDVHTNHCSLAHIFDCGNPRMQIDGSAMWLQLTPRESVGCDVRLIDIHHLTGEGTVPRPLVILTEEFEVNVRESLQLTVDQRKARLTSATRLPRRIEVTTTVFDRNPDVVAEVLSRAKGVCDKCNKPAPFYRRTDGTPYLEVHHLIHLAVGGEDTVENAVALCPNCHREKHYG